MTQKQPEAQPIAGPRLAHRSFGSRSVESSFSTFAQRNELWELQRARRCEERRLHRQAEELAECSFQPHSVPRAESDVRSSTRASKGDEGAAWSLIDRLRIAMCTDCLAASVQHGHGVASVPA
eukprot:3691066-Amphidinium_carterae.2